MISVEQAQTALDAIRAQNAFLRRQLARRKQRDMRAIETKHEYEHEYEHEQPHFAVPGLDEVLSGSEQEAEALMEAYNL